MKLGLLTYRRLRRSATGTVVALVVLLLAAGAAVAAVVATTAEPPPPVSTEGLLQRLARSQAPREASGAFSWDNRLVPGPLLRREGERAASPLLTGGRGRFWYSAGRGVRVELQGRTGDLLLVGEGRTLWIYDGSSRVARRVDLSREDGHERGGERKRPGDRERSRGLERLERRFEISEPRPAVEADQPAYGLRAVPRDRGGLLAGLAGSVEAGTGVPLRLEVLAEGAEAPVLSARVEELSFGPVDSSRFAFSPPPGARVDDGFFLVQWKGNRGRGRRDHDGDVRRYGRGAGAIRVFRSDEEDAPDDRAGDDHFEGSPLPEVALPGGVRGRLLETPLGSVLSWRADGVRYVAAGSRPAADVIAAARSVTRSPVRERSSGE